MELLRYNISSSVDDKKLSTLPSVNRIHTLHLLAIIESGVFLHLSVLQVSSLRAL